MKPVLISACLLGCPCRYDGASKAHPEALTLAREVELIPICPSRWGACLPPGRLPCGGETPWSPNTAGM